jgi:hypothetical protein
MGKWTIFCECGKHTTKDLNGEGKIVCKKCKKIYKIIFNPHTEGYEIKA